MSLEEKIKDKRQLLSIHYRHLQKDKEQQAAYGIAAPAYLLIEIENREALIEELQQELVKLESDLEQGLEEPEITVRQSPPNKLAWPMKTLASPLRKCS